MLHGIHVTFVNYTSVKMRKVDMFVILHDNGLIRRKIIE